LLLTWAEGGLPEQEQPEWVTEWQAGRAARAAVRRQKADTPRTEAQERAARRRSGSRLDRVTAGAAELHQWVADQIRHGIAGLERAGYAHFERMATRMVDAQAPGLASMVRRLSGVPHSGEGWEGRMLAELSLVHLLTDAAARLDDLPEGLATTVRSRLGQTVGAEQVLATEPVRDAWQVIGVRDFIEERLSTRRTWLVGRDSGREALVLSFAAPGQALAADLLLGTEIDADASPRGDPTRPGGGTARAAIAQAAPRSPSPRRRPPRGGTRGRPVLGSWPCWCAGAWYPAKNGLVDEAGSASRCICPGGVLGPGRRGRPRAPRRSRWNGARPGSPRWPPRAGIGGARVGELWHQLLSNAIVGTQRSRAA
jgi:hypothetical protein